ncbi:MAG: pyridoxamine 5'-phosphate oxidase [Ignavibacteriaceae bacterium]|nr:pyridoxamine 5'-phosphate oxidase [Ignavibacteriaceae bacterium]
MFNLGNLVLKGNGEYGGRDKQRKDGSEDFPADTGGGAGSGVQYFCDRSLFLIMSAFINKSLIIIYKKFDIYGATKRGKRKSMEKRKGTEGPGMKSWGKGLSESGVSRDPFEQFGIWYKEAVMTERTEQNAMIISTAGKEGMPSVRTVLLKSFDKDGFVFYTNYGSLKGKELAENPRAAILFLWKETERQVRIRGKVIKTNKGESEAYFRSRPRESQLGAWASKQGEWLKDREHLIETYEKYRKEFEGKEVPMPEYWGGYRVVPTEFEFWQGRENRMHDRICYSLKGYGWHIYRLSP